MKIAIIGTGKVGSTLAKGLKTAGHQIYLGVRNISHFKGQELLKVSAFEILSITDAIQTAEVVILAVPPKVIPEITQFLAQSEEKIIIDPTNSFPAPPKGFSNTFEVLEKQSPCSHLVKVFNTTGYQNMADPQGLDAFAAGDSKKAKEAARQLAMDLGFANCYDFGGNERAGLLEQLGICWINLALFQGLGTDIEITIKKRGTIED